MKKEKLTPWEYVVNEEKRTVVYSVLAHGKLFVGKAKCGEGDKFDVEKGKTIAHMRAILAQRKYDLELTREFIHNVKIAKGVCETFNEGISSPHYMRAIQAACEEERAQLAHIADIKKRLSVECAIA